ncbi:MAG TPA: DUF4349 domain-containing protein [Candidatus Binatus sp.]|nr:DUF4349 domain-containing protein [Candidatus Binatus sp.]
MTRSIFQPGGRRPPALGAAALAVVVVALAACGGAAVGPDSLGGAVPAASAASAVEAGPAALPDQAAGSTSGSSSFGDVSNGRLNDATRPDLLIIKTGSLSLQVAGIDAALASASSRIAAVGGYVSGSDRSGDGDQQVATETYRLPAAQWDAALVALRGLADKVLAEQTQTQDVTGQVVDLGARITNLKATEAALQAIMAKATKITDVLEVQQQLTDVRGQIEELTTQQTHLQGQAAYSTLTVSYSLKPQAAVVTSQRQFDPGAEVDRASASLIEVLQGLATAGIWFGIVWLPILLVLGVLAGISVLVVRRIRHNRPGSGPILPTPSAPAAEA